MEEVAHERVEDHDFQRFQRTCVLWSGIIRYIVCLGSRSDSNLACPISKAIPLT